MPSVGTQMYWHEAQEPQPPWASEEQKATNLNLSKLLGQTKISPIRGQWLVGNRATDLKKERKKHYEERRRLLAVKKPKMLAEPLLSHRSALNTLFRTLGVKPMSIRECARLVRGVIPKIGQGDFPMVVCVQEMAASRGLETRVLTKDEVKNRRGTFFPGDLPPGERALVICSKIEPMFVAAYTEWLPTNRHVGKSIRRGHNGAMRVMCPAHQPQPWHKRFRNLKRVDRNATVSIYLTTSAAAQTLDGGRTSAKKSSEKGQPAAATSAGATSHSRDPLQPSDSDVEEEEDDEIEDEDDDWDAVEEELILQSVAEASRAGRRRGGVAQAAQIALPTILEPIQLEETANVEDPFATLPIASNVVIAAVQSSLTNIQARSTATWTQRLLQLPDRKMLYDLAQQIAMTE